MGRRVFSAVWLVLALGLAGCGNLAKQSSPASLASDSATAVPTVTHMVTATVTAAPATPTTPAVQPVQPVQPVYVPPPCPQGSVQFQLTSAKIGAPVGNNGGYGGFQARPVDIKVTVTNRTNANISLSSGFGPKVWADPYTMGKNQLAFFTQAPAGSPTLMTVTPDQSVVFAYSEPAYIDNGFVWLQMTDLRIDPSGTVLYASDFIRPGCSATAATVFSDPVPVSLR